MLQKAIKTIMTQYRSRGLFHTILMNAVQLFAFARGFIYKLLYLRSISGRPFAMQGGSTIEIFNSRAKLHVGRFVFLRKNISIRIDDEGQLKLGHHAFINDNCTINCALEITIGDYAKIAPNVCINDHDHNYRGTEEGHLLKGSVHIGDHVWIGAGAIILRGTHIGDNAVIAAGSIVKGHIPANTLYLNKREKQFSPIRQERQDLFGLGTAKGAGAV